MRDNIAAELMNLKKRTMDEMITYFNDVVSEMNIPCKDKMTLLGMITAIGYEAQNAADVVPVRHGRWIEQPLDFDMCGVAYYQCSECGKEQQTPSNYCQFCGAKMDLGTDCTPVKGGDGE